MNKWQLRFLLSCRKKKKTFKFTDLKNLKETGGEQRTKKMSEKEEKKTRLKINKLVVNYDGNGVKGQGCQTHFGLD